MKIGRFMVVVGLCLAVSIPGFGAVSEAGNATKYLLLQAAGDEVVRPAPLTFQDIPGLGGALKVGGKVPTCIVATFSGQFGGPIYIQALVDGVLMEGHSTDAPGIALQNSGSYSFWMCDVAPGVHAVQIQWLAWPGGWMRGRTLIVEGR